MNTYFLVFSNPIDGKEAEYNDWYTNVHLKEVVAIEGFKSAQRFILTKEQQNESQPHKYLAIYEIENQDIKGTLQSLKAASSKMNMEPVIDLKNVKVSIFQSITDVIK